MYMNLRSKSKMDTVSDDLKKYFQKLIKNLATNDSITSLIEKFASFEEKMVDRFEKRFLEQEEKIEKLEASLVLRQNAVDKLFDKLENSNDNVEQYSRRACLRIHGIECYDNEITENVVADCFKELDMSFGKEVIDRTHRVGEVYQDDVSKKNVRSIIVKFKSWNERTAFYRARPKLFSKGVKKQGVVLPFRVSLDLTKRRHDLLKYAKDLIENSPKFLYVFADINCSLVIKDNDNKYHYFNSKRDLTKIINNL